MPDHSPDLRGEAVEPRSVQPSRGRHAFPRTPALTRLRLPLGKALALTALPTALVLGSRGLPAADTTATVAHSVSEEEAGAGVDCARPDDSSASAAAASVSPTPTAARRASSAPKGDEPVKPSEPVAEERTGPVEAPAAAPTPTPTLSPSASSTASGLAGIIGTLFGDNSAQRSPAPDASPSPTSEPHASPSPSPTSPSPTSPTSEATAPSDPLLPSPHASPATGHRPAEPSPGPPRPESTGEADRTCDIGDLEAPEDNAAGPFAAESWNMKGSRVALYDVVFGGVVTVDTAAGPKRVLKFSAADVTIRDLKMAVPVGPEVQHIDGGPGSTSTLKGDRITMYVESLTGTVSGVEGLPVPSVLRLHLTPDTVPEWLLDTVGKLGLKLQLTLDDADIDQAGQTGGELVIPGIHGYGTPR
ncbi:hypothetical protein OG241_45270 [Streptomyces sp. NBC_01390]|uniref:hypothetical protein n=1 Tax=Streptomyces sp. NBC_01390 TaxID=2903850 RepID=UPI003243F206